jgi:hypothetical protein
MIRRFVVLMAVLLGAFASTGYAGETSEILVDGKVTGRFPVCSFSPPLPYLQPSAGSRDRGFIFLPAQLRTLNGKEGVYASWYRFNPDNFFDPTNFFISGIWPLSAVTITQTNPRNVKLEFKFDATSGGGRGGDFLFFTGGRPPPNQREVGRNL